MKLLDARGLSCPEPVIMLRNAMKSGEAAYRIVVDDHAARENVTRYAQHMGYQVDMTQKNDEYTLVMKR